MSVLDLVQLMHPVPLWRLNHMVNLIIRTILKTAILLILVNWLVPMKHKHTKSSVYGEGANTQQDCAFDTAIGETMKLSFCSVLNICYNI